MSRPYCLKHDIVEQVIEMPDGKERFSCPLCETKSDILKKRAKELGIKAIDIKIKSAVSKLMKAKLEILLFQVAIWIGVVAFFSATFFHSGLAPYHLFLMVLNFVLAGSWLSVIFEKISSK